MYCARLPHSNLQPARYLIPYRDTRITYVHLIVHLYRAHSNVATSIPCTITTPARLHIKDNPSVFLPLKVAMNRPEIKDYT